MDWGKAALHVATQTQRAARMIFALLLLAAAFALNAPALHAAEFSGSYDGIGDAAGMSLVLSEIERRVVGKLTLPSGLVYALNGERAGAGEGDAQGALRRADGGGSGAYFHVEERPLGVQFLFIPSRADGTPDLALAREYSFLTKGAKLPAAAQQEPYRPAPAEPVDVVVFLDSFRSWSPEAISQHYAALPDKARGLVLLYDHATAELMWRLCEAAPQPGTESAKRLAEIQDRQQTDCATYLRLVKAAQAGGLFPEFLRRSLFQLELVRATILCDRGETSPARCADASALAAPLVLRWRRADAIMAELAGDVEIEEPAEDAAAGDEESVEAVAEAVPASPQAVPPSNLKLPLARPGGADHMATASNARDEAIDFEPDVSTLSIETIRTHRLPLRRP